MASKPDVSVKFGFVRISKAESGTAVVSLGPLPYRGNEQFHQARLVRITHRRLAIWLDPLRMLDPQIIANLLQQFCEGADFVGHGNDSVENSSGPGEDSLSRSPTGPPTGDSMRARQ